MKTGDDQNIYLYHNERGRDKNSETNTVSKWSWEQDGEVSSSFANGLKVPRLLDYVASPF